MDARLIHRAADLGTQAVAEIRFAIAGFPSVARVQKRFLVTVKSGMQCDALPTRPVGHVQVRLSGLTVDMFALVASAVGRFDNKSLLGGFGRVSAWRDRSMPKPGAPWYSDMGPQLALFTLLIRGIW